MAGEFEKDGRTVASLFVPTEHVPQLRAAALYYADEYLGDDLRGSFDGECERGAGWWGRIGLTSAEYEQTWPDLQGLSQGLEGPRNSIQSVARRVPQAVFVVERGTREVGGVRVSLDLEDLLSVLDLVGDDEGMWKVRAESMSDELPAKHAARIRQKVETAIEAAIAAKRWARQERLRLSSRPSRASEVMDPRPQGAAA